MKTKTLFDHLNTIYTSNSVSYFDNLDDADKKTYNSYMINRLVSMNPSYIDVANTFQMYVSSDSRTSYLFYSQLLPNKKQFNKYIKAEKKNNFDDWLIELFSEYFQISLTEAEYYLTIMVKTQEGKDEIVSICQENAIDTKLIDKLKI